jgi:hypothetical protein
MGDLLKAAFRYRFRSSFPLLLRRNPLKNEIVLLIWYWLCMISDASYKNKWDVSTRKCRTSTIKLKMLTDWAANFIHNSVTLYIAIAELLVGLNRNRDIFITVRSELLPIESVVNKRYYYRYLTYQQESVDGEYVR